VEGTKFTVKDMLATNNTCTTDVNVLEGTVYVEDRSRDATEIAVIPTMKTSVAVLQQVFDSSEIDIGKIVPRKPKKYHK